MIGVCASTQQNMKKLPFIIVLIIAGAWAFSACSSDSKTVYEMYSEWYEENETWLQEQKSLTDADGSPYYSTIVPSWNNQAYVLIHYYNDRSLTAGNLSPLYTSTVDTRYHLYYCDDTPIDSSTNITTYGQGIFRTKLSEVIDGWSIALLDMRCGDSAEVIIPYAQGYGVSTSSSVLPYSNLRFQIKLVDIPYYGVNN